MGLGLGVNQVAGAAGFLLGPVVGGLLTAISWRWVFLINVPIGIFGTIWGMWRLREPVRLPAHQRFDWLGSLTFVDRAGSLLLALSLVAFPMLPMTVVNGLFVVAVIGLVAFIVVELRSPQPMLDLSLFGDRLFGFAALAGGLNGLARGAVLFVLIFFLQGPYGMDPLMAGLMMTPFGAAFLLVGPISGYLSDHYGSRLLATSGLLISAVGLLGLSTITAETPYWVLAAYMVLMGGGSGLFTLAERERADEHGAAAAARHGLGHQHDGRQHRPDAEHRDRVSAGAQSNSRGRDVPGVPVRRRHGRRAGGAARVRAGAAHGIPGVVRDHDRGRAGVGAATGAQPARGRRAVQLEGLRVRGRGDLVFPHAHGDLR